MTTSSSIAGVYARHLANVFGLFPRSRCALLFYDDLVERPLQFVRELYQYVGVDPGLLPGVAADTL